MVSKIGGGSFTLVRQVGSLRLRKNLHQRSIPFKEPCTVRCTGKNKAHGNVVKYLPAHLSDLLFNSSKSSSSTRPATFFSDFCDEKCNTTHKPNRHTELPNP